MGNEVLKRIMERLGSFFKFYLKDLLLFVFCSAIAFVGWIVLKAREDFEMEVRIPIRLTNIPRLTYVIYGLTTEVSVTISDKGEAMLLKREHEIMDTINIDYTLLEEDKNHVKLNTSALRELVRSKVSPTSKIISIFPSSLDFHITRNSPKMVDVQIRSSFYPDRNRMISGEIDYSPKTITIIGIPEVLDTLTTVYTEALSFNNLKDTLRTSIPIVQPDGTFIEQNRVEVIVPIEEYTQKEVSVPIKVLNLPEEYRLSLFPSEANVKCMVRLSQYSKLNASQFEVAVDYNEILSGKKNTTLTLLLRKSPNSLFSSTLENKKVDYVLEKIQQE